MRKGPGESRVKGVFGQGGSVRVCRESESWVGLKKEHTHTHIYTHTAQGGAASCAAFNLVVSSCRDYRQILRCKLLKQCLAT